MNLAETFSKNYLTPKESRMIKKLAQDAIQVLKDEITSQKIFLDHNNMFHTNVSHIHEILETSKSEITAKSCIVMYIASFARELNAQLNPDELAIIGMKKIEKKFPFFSSNSIGFFNSQLTDEIKENTQLTKEVIHIIRRLFSATFYPKYILDDLKEVTILSTFYEQKNLDKTISLVKPKDSHHKIKL